MNIAEFEDYRALLRNSLEQKKQQLGMAYTFQNMAKACKVQKTYLSTVLRGAGHLNEDQVFLACKYLGYNSYEFSFARDLHRWQRSSVDEHRDILAKNLKLSRRKIKGTVAKLNFDSNSKNLSEYYGDPYAQIVHIFLTIPKYAENPKLIEKILGLSGTRIAQILSMLSRLKICEFREEKWSILHPDLHLDRDSDHYLMHRRHTLTNSLRRIESENSEDYSFSVVFSADEATQKKIQEEFLEFVKKSRHLAEKSKKEKVIQCNFDLFSWN